MEQHVYDLAPGVAGRPVTATRGTPAAVVACWAAAAMMPRRAPGAHWQVRGQKSHHLQRLTDN